MQSRDLILLERLKKGEASAFKQLFDLYYMPLSVYALKYCGSFQLAEDIVQELFVKLWEEKLFMKFEGTIGPYLFKAVKNNTFQAIKKQSKYQFEDIDHQVNLLFEDQEIDKDGLEEEKRKLYKAIDDLPDKCKEVFKAIVLQNMKYKEAAKHLGVSLNTVKTHYSRALKQLRNSLDIIVLMLLM
ncbi:RNA polymerase sigma factor [Aestuariivivens insulae]|uniref:RNA polymerase sigma factor n=1 Tax=Aestuariivivens insulae TaxID=1621988 RepID=UPI001F5668E1|nr:RNA polymerase sigma-70 factor [Aestuariivivens insulae]